MENTILENQIRELKNIKPRENWKFCAKNEILKEEQVIPKIFGYTLSPVFAVLLIFCLTVYFTQTKIIPSGELASLIPVLQEHKTSEFYLTQAENKVRDLEKLSLANDPNIDTAIQETKESLRQAVYSIPKVPTSQEEVDAITEKTKAITETAKDLDLIETRVLAAKVSKYIKNGIEVANNKLELFIYDEINRLENSNLTEEQLQEFESIKKEFKLFQETEDYSLLNKIAERIYMLQN